MFYFARSFLGTLFLFLFILLFSMFVLFGPNFSFFSSFFKNSSQLAGQPSAVLSPCAKMFRWFLYFLAAGLLSSLLGVQGFFLPFPWMRPW